MERFLSRIPRLSEFVGFHLSRGQKTLLQAASEENEVSMSEYVRTVAVEAAKRDLQTPVGFDPAA